MKFMAGVCAHLVQLESFPPKCAICGDILAHEGARSIAPGLSESVKKDGPLSLSACNNYIPETIYLETFPRSMLNTSVGIPLKAWSCQALEQEAQRLDYVPAQLLRTYQADIERLTKDRDTADRWVQTWKQTADARLQLAQEYEKKALSCQDFIDELAKQKLPEEILASDYNDADFEGAYELIVQKARTLKGLQ